MYPRRGIVFLLFIGACASAQTTQPLPFNPATPVWTAAPNDAGAFLLDAVPPAPAQPTAWAGAIEDLTSHEIQFAGTIYRASEMGLLIRQPHEPWRILPNPITPFHKIEPLGPDKDALWCALNALDGQVHIQRLNLKTREFTRAFVQPSAGAIKRLDKGFVIISQTGILFLDDDGNLRGKTETNAQSEPPSCWIRETPNFLWVGYIHYRLENMSLNLPLPPVAPTPAICIDKRTATPVADFGGPLSSRFLTHGDRCYAVRGDRDPTWRYLDDSKKTSVFLCAFDPVKRQYVNGPPLFDGPLNIDAARIVDNKLWLNIKGQIRAFDLDSLQVLPADKSQNPPADLADATQVPAVAPMAYPIAISRAVTLPLDRSTFLAAAANTAWFISPDATLTLIRDDGTARQTALKTIWTGTHRRPPAAFAVGDKLALVIDNTVYRVDPGGTLATLPFPIPVLEGSMIEPLAAAPDGLLINYMSEKKFSTSGLLNLQTGKFTPPTPAEPRTPAPDDLRALAVCYASDGRSVFLLDRAFTLVESAGLDQPLVQLASARELIDDQFLASHRNAQLVETPDHRFLARLKDTFILFDPADHSARITAAPTIDSRHPPMLAFNSSFYPPSPIPAPISLALQNPRLSYPGPDVRGTPVQSTARYIYAQTPIGPYRLPYK